MEINEKTLIVDSREKWTQRDSDDYHISNYLIKHNIPWVVHKLAVGDYMMFGGCTSVDRKHSIEEISHNLTNPKDRERFQNEVRLAYKLKIHLVILIESAKYRDIYDLRGWVSKYSPVNGDTLIRKMERLQFAYGVRFLFVNPRSVAKKIVEILGAECKDRWQR